MSVNLCRFFSTNNYLICQPRQIHYYARMSIKSFVNMQQLFKENRRIYNVPRPSVNSLKLETFRYYSI